MEIEFESISLCNRLYEVTYTFHMSDGRLHYSRHFCTVQSILTKDKPQTSVSCCSLGTRSHSEHSCQPLQCLVIIKTAHAVKWTQQKLDIHKKIKFLKLDCSLYEVQLTSS